jgi:hypothetical protein
MRLENETAIFAGEEVSEHLGARLTSPVDVIRFMTAGKACLTLVSVKTGARFTYKIRASDDGKVFFVSLLTGPDNNNDYAYLGTIHPGTVYRPGSFYKHGVKSRISMDAPGAKAFHWAFRQLDAGREPADLEVWHEGSCGRCGRRLTVPESIASGFGPECIGKV